MEIEKTSKCECGQPLELGDHSIGHGKDGAITITAKYQCSKSHAKVRRFGSAVKNVISKGWQDIKKIKVGASGVEIERQSGPTKLESEWRGKTIQMSLEADD